MTLAELTYYAFLLRNDLHHIHLHAAGPQFDKVHSITDELYDEAQDEVDNLAEMAISEGCEVKSFTEVRSIIDDSQWPTLEGEVFDMPTFIVAFDEIGHRYLEAIENCDCTDVHKAALDEIALFWDKEVNFFNAARQVGCKDWEDYSEVNEENSEEDPFSNEEDIYSYEDAMDDSEVLEDDNFGLQAMSTDMLVSTMDDTSDITELYNISNSDSDNTEDEALSEDTESDTEEEVEDTEKEEEN